jgi:hypothetical protein
MFDVNANAGDINLLHELAATVGGGGAAVAGTIQALLPFISDLGSLPVSFGFKKADSTVEVGQGTAQPFALSSVNAPIGQITFASGHGLITGDPVTYASSGTAIGGLTSGATYFVIADSPTTLRLATSKANALAGTAVTNFNNFAATGVQSITPNSQIAGADVNIESAADSDAEGEAIYYGQFGKANVNVLSTAFAIAIGVPTANALIDSGSQITADGSVTVASNATSTTNNLARVSQNLALISTPILDLTFFAG